jgi:heme ABC exporter ATP-binding subunit CcmA
MSHRPADLRLQLHRVSKLFGTRVALWQVDFDASAGEFVLAVGANGVGKSTLLRVVAGLISPTAGDVDWMRSSQPAQPRVSYVGHASGLYEELTPFEHLVLTARLTRTEPSEGMVLLERLGAAAVAGEPCGHLSAGMRRRVALARAFASGADAILLDEPLAALDDSGVTAVVGLIEDATRHGRLVLAASPSDGRLRAVADRTLALVDGHVLRSLSLPERRPEQIDAR